VTAGESFQSPVGKLNGCTRTSKLPGTIMIELGLADWQSRLICGITLRICHTIIQAADYD
jgi:hypothetical protein